MVGSVFNGVSTITNTPGRTSTINQVIAGTGGGAGDLFLAMLDYENNVAWAGTGFSGFTAPGGDGSVFTTGGSATSNVVMECRYLAGTAGGSVGFTPTGMVNDGGACCVQLQATSTTSPGFVHRRGPNYRR